MSALLLLVGALGALAAVLVIVNSVAYAPLWSAGWRPRRLPPTTDAFEVDDPHQRLRARLIIGYPGQRTPSGDLLISRRGMRLLGGGPPFNLHRERVRSVRVVRWWAGSWVRFDADDNEYGGFLVRPDDLDAALAALRALGWPVAEPAGAARA